MKFKIQRFADTSYLQDNLKGFVPNIILMESDCLSKLTLIFQM